MPVRVGIIGSSFARTAYLPALAHTPGAEVVALSSARLERAREASREYGVPRAYDDWSRMFDEEELDLVCIATPPHLHAPMTHAALGAGAHVLCEKPMAMSRHEAGRMLAHAERLDRVHMVDHELRFNPNRLHAKKLIDSGYIGEVRHVHLVNTTGGWADRSSRGLDDWWSRVETGGGRLGANGSHQIDLIRWWFGEVRAVYGRLLTLVPERVDPDSGREWSASADDHAEFMLEMESGLRVSVFITGVAYHDFGNIVRIFGDDGTIVLRNVGPSMRSRDDELLVARRRADFEDLSQPDPEAELAGVGPLVWHAGVVALLRELVGAVGRERPLSHGATFLDGLRCQQVIDAVRQSSSERCWVTVPSDDPSDHE